MVGQPTAHGRNAARHAEIKVSENESVHVLTLPQDMVVRIVKEHEKPLKNVHLRTNAQFPVCQLGQLGQDAPGHVAEEQVLDAEHVRTVKHAVDINWLKREDVEQRNVAAPINIDSLVEVKVVDLNTPIHEDVAMVGKEWVSQDVNKCVTKMPPLVDVQEEFATLLFGTEIQERYPAGVNLVRRTVENIAPTMDIISSEENVDIWTKILVLAELYTTSPFGLSF